MTHYEQEHCDQVFKCLVAKKPTLDGVPVEEYRSLIDEVAIISAKLALLTMEAPVLSAEDRELLDTLMASKISTSQSHTQ
jgi:hypothetical protein